MLVYRAPKTQKKEPLHKSAVLAGKQEIDMKFVVIFVDVLELRSYG